MIIRARDLNYADRKRFVELEFEKKARVSLDTRRVLEFERLMAARAYIGETWFDQKKK
jgi:hypothetical protein